MWKYTESINNMISKLSKEEILEWNKIEINRTEIEYAEFVEYYKKWECYLCKKSLNNFSTLIPCLHYLLRTNKKFKKKNFKEIYKKWGYFEISSYLRWVANQEKFISNINNLEDEKENNKKFEYTIKWQNKEWTFSCSNGDYKWHDWVNSNFPHYHFQMKIDWQIFIKFSDYHIWFNDYDFFTFDMKDHEKVKHWFWYGWLWIQDILDDFDKLPDWELDDILSNMIRTEDGNESQFNIRTIFTWWINWDELNDIINESKKSWKTLNTLLKERFPENRIQTIISPTDILPDISKRKWRYDK